MKRFDQASSSAVPGYEKVVTCPYNASHQILPHRMQTHLVKCAKQNPDVKLQICPFNQTHRIRDELFENHKKDCPDRATFDRYTTLMDEKPYVEDRKIEVIPPKVDVEESWDELHQKSYDPKKYIEKNPVFRSCNGMTRTQRKAFRASEEARIKSLQQ